MANAEINSWDVACDHAFSIDINITHTKQDSHIASKLRSSRRARGENYTCMRLEPIMQVIALLVRAWSMLLAGKKISDWACSENCDSNSSKQRQYKGSDISCSEKLTSKCDVTFSLS